MIRELSKTNRINRFSIATSPEGILILSCIFSVGLTVFRMLYTGRWTFAFLLWNLFLAVIPFLISCRFDKGKQTRITWATVVRMIVWLVFIPNTFYIITDLFHLDMSADMPQWYDLLLLFSFAWNGLLLGVTSIRQMSAFVIGFIRPLPELLFVYGVMFLNAFGVYIGRYLRFNSWDVVTNPFHLMQDIVYMMVHPLRNRFDWCMVIAYSLFMTLIYYSLKSSKRSN